MLIHIYLQIINLHEFLLHERNKSKQKPFKSKKTVTQTSISFQLLNHLFPLFQNQVFKFIIYVSLAALLRYNWVILIYRCLKYSIGCILMYILCEVITTVKVVNYTSPPSFLISLRCQHLRHFLSLSQVIILINFLCIFPDFLYANKSKSEYMFLYFSFLFY